MTPNQASRKIVDEIVADLSGRKGLDNEWDSIDSDVKSEIINTWLIIAKNYCESVQQEE